MKSEFVTAIWLAKFNSEKELSDYLSWVYPPGADEPVCMFATDIGLDVFDEDFLESAHVESHSDMNTLLDEISFSVYFRDELLERLRQLKVSEYNSIIALSGVRNERGSDNEELFEFNDSSDRPYLQFAGIFEFELND